MMSMSQQEEKRTSLFEEEEETESSPKKNMQAAPRRTRKEQPVKKDRKYYMKRFIGVLCAAVLAVTVRTAYNNSTLFLEDRSAEGYLSAEDYVFYQDGEAMQNVRSISFQDDYISQYSDEGVTTSRGITYGDSWEDFVKAYGDVRCEYVWYHRVLKDGSNNYSFDETQFPETDGILIKMKPATVVYPTRFATSDDDIIALDPVDPYTPYFYVLEPGTVTLTVTCAGKTGTIEVTVE